MEEKSKIKQWEKKDRDLVNKIENFYSEYRNSFKTDFDRNEFAAHIRMLRISGKIFKREIEAQITELAELNKSFLTECLN